MKKLYLTLTTLLFTLCSCQSPDYYDPYYNESGENLLNQPSEHHFHENTYPYEDSSNQGQSVGGLMWREGIERPAKQAFRKVFD